MLKSTINKKPAAIALAALDTEFVKEQLATLKDAGIPVVGFDSGVPGAPEGSIYATASTDNKAAAAIAAEHLFADESFAAKVAAATADAPITVAVISQDATSESIVSRTTGFIDKLVELVGEDLTSVEGHDKYARANDAAVLKIVVNVPAMTSAADQKTGAEALLSLEPAAIYASNENAAGGVLAASNDGSDFDSEKSLDVCQPQARCSCSRFVVYFPLRKYPYYEQYNSSYNNFSHHKKSKSHCYCKEKYRT